MFIWLSIEQVKTHRILYKLPNKIFFRVPGDTSFRKSDLVENILLVVEKNLQTDDFE